MVRQPLTVNATGPVHQTEGLIGDIDPHVTDLQTIVDVVVGTVAVQRGRLGQLAPLVKAAALDRKSVV